MKTRVLQIVPDLVPYGLEKIVASLALLGDRKRFEMSVVSLYGDTPDSMGRDLSASGVKVFFLDKRRGFDPRMYPRLSRVFRDVRPHVIHSHNYVLRYTLPALLGVPIPAMVHTVHNVADRETDRLGIWLQQRAFRSIVCPVAIAGEVAASYERTYRLPSPVLIPNGIAVDDYSPDPERRERYRRELGYSPEELLFICLARFYPQKNHKTLLEAFAAGPGRLPNARLLLAGDGDLREAAEAQARSLGMGDKVRFLGRRGDVAALLGASDAFVLASLWEGNPLAVMEAMASGLPVVVTSVGGVPELVEHELSGILVPPGDAPALSAGMMRVAADQLLRRSYGARAAKRAKERFDHRVMVSAYERLYERLLSGESMRGADALAVA